MSVSAVQSTDLTGPPKLDLPLSPPKSVGLSRNIGTHARFVPRSDIAALRHPGPARMAASEALGGEPRPHDDVPKP